MRRQVRLYIGGQEADLGENDLILFNYTQEDLTNPTIVKNSYTQRVTLKGTPANNDIFGHIWRLDRQQGFGGEVGSDFDPSRKTGFRLFDGAGQLLESGYVKLDNILRHGVDVQYSVTLYGGLGSFLYGLSFDSEGNQRSLADLDFLGTGDPDRELDFTINADTVLDAWSRLLSNPPGVSNIWDVINFAPCYNGVPDRFGAGKGIVKPTEIGLQATHPEDSTYGTLNGWALLTMTRNMTEWEAKDLRSYLQRPVVSVKAVLNAIANPKNNGGFAFDASVLDGGDYDNMWMTLPLLPSLADYKNVSRSITLTLDGSTHDDSFNTPVSIGASLQVGSKVDVNMNIAFNATVSGATATPLYFSSARYSGGIGTTERYDFSGFFVQLVAYDGQNRELAASKAVCVGSSEDYGQFDKDGKTRAEAVGFESKLGMDYAFVEAVLSGSSGSYRLSSDINLSLSCYNAETYRIWVTPYHFRKTIHFGEFYRKTWRSHSVGTDAMRVYHSETEYTYTAMRLSSGAAGSTASYKTPESIRSGAAVTKSMLLSTDYSPADFLLGVVKSLGLILRHDNQSGTVTLMSRNDYFKNEVIDIDKRVDRGREVHIAPLAFDTKWLEMSSEAYGGAFERYYRDTYGGQYGAQRIGTGYDFNSDTRQLMESVVFREAVQAVENSRYFNDVTAGGVDVLSQQLDAGNSLAYRNASGDTKPYDVPVASSPSISYWGSASFPDVDGYDWLLAGKPQCHDADGKPLDGSGVLLWRTGAQVYDRFKVSDDTQEMMTLNDGTPCWRMDEGPGVTVPVFGRHKTSPIYKMVTTTEFEYRGEGVTASLDFGRAREFASPYTAYFPGDDTVTVYEKMWRAYLRDRYDVNTRVVTCWVNLAGIQVGADCLRRFWWFDNSVWSLNRIINASVTTDDPVQCEFVKVGDKSAYLYGQDFGGSQLRGFLSLTVSPATAIVSVDGRRITLDGGQAVVSLTAGRHIVEATGDGLETVTQPVNVIPEETVTLSITLQPRQSHLTIVTLPAGLSPTITLRVNGTVTTYTEGMVVASGATVAVTVSKSGYTTVTDSFTMPGSDITKTYTLTRNIMATIAYPDEITYAAQAVRMTISDPSGHGWYIDWTNATAYVTGGTVVSGSATKSGYRISGTGDAVITLSVTQNTSEYGRWIGYDPNSIYFKDETDTSGAEEVHFYQNESSASIIPVTSVTLNKSTMSLGSGASERLTATVRPTNATNKTLTWTTSDSSVATVSQDGTVHAVAAGTATIRATATDGSGKYATCTVTVTSSTVPVTGVSVSPSSIDINAGDEYTLVAVIQPTNATNRNVSWISQDLSVVSVNENGRITGLAEGTTEVTCVTQDGGFVGRCNVTVHGVGILHADNIVVRSTVQAAATELTAVGVTNIVATKPSSVSWITSVTVDTSNTPYYVRLEMAPNGTGADRTATITVTGSRNGELQTTTFTVTQRAWSSSDVPVESMTVEGVAVLQNAANEATYGVALTPSNTTQAAVTWQVTGGGAYITVEEFVTSIIIHVLEGARNLQLTITATNSYNTAVTASKTITATYVYPDTSISVNPDDVGVYAEDTGDATPVVSGSYQTSSLTATASGFIQTAAVINGRVRTTFAANTSTEPREGTVTLNALDLNGNPISAVINYTQLGRQETVVSFRPVALNVTGSGNPFTAQMAVEYFNTSAQAVTFTGLWYTILGYNSRGTQVCNKSGQLPSKTVSASTEVAIYDLTLELFGPVERYVITVSNGSESASHESDGHEEI